MPASHHSVFLQAGCPSCRQTNSVKALSRVYRRLKKHLWKPSIHSIQIFSINGHKENTKYQQGADLSAMLAGTMCLMQMAFRPRTVAEASSMPSEQQNGRSISTSSGPVAFCTASEYSTSVHRQLPQVCIQLPASAVHVVLPAFTAACHAAGYQSTVCFIRDMT